MSNQSRFNWAFKYKLHHIPFWIGYHFVWWWLRIGSPIDVVNSIFLPHAGVKFLSYLLFQMMGVYFNLYFLIPRFLEKGRYITYTLLFLTTIVATACVIVSGYYFGAAISESTFQELWGVEPSNFYSLFESGALPSTAAAMTLAMSIKLTKNWISARQRQRELEKEKIETELKFLRAQINPHFLFNTINSIFVLIKKNPAMASEALSRFSDLLRYQLYECNDHEIDLNQELAYLEGYVELEQLRLDKDIVSVNIELQKEPQNELRIAPFILTPFVENAFKHVSKTKGQLNSINISLVQVNDELRFKVVNTCSPEYPVKDYNQHKGLGLENVRRRLNLMYPENHDLKIKHTNNLYEIMLSVNLRNKEMQMSLPLTNVS